MRAMAFLASTYGSGPVPLSLVARTQRVPRRYLERIIGDLRRAGIVVSRRGVSGGYELSRPPERVTVADILKALDGNVLPLDCGGSRRCSFRTSLDACVAKPLWQALQRQLDDSLSRVTLAAMATSLNTVTLPADPESKVVCI